MDSAEKSRIELYEGVLVFCEQRDGRILPTNYEITSEARKLADQLGTKVTCLVLGDEIHTGLRKLAGYGADRILVCRGKNLAEYSTDAYTSIVCQVVETERPEILLFCATSTGRDLAPRCAARLHTGLTADCTRLDVDMDAYVEYLRRESSLDVNLDQFEQSRSLKMTRPAFGGHLMATIICPRFRPCISTVRPGAMRCGEYDVKRADCCVIEEIDNTVSDSLIRVQVLEKIRNAVQKVDFSGADIVVSVGRGISNDVERGMALARELADAVGGAPIGGSRATVDNGWLPEDCQIGQTGKTIHPKLYIALGISGAMQHLVGVSGAEYILAINKDARAPILEIADYAIIDDLFKVVPILTNEIRKARGIIPVATGGQQDE